VCGGGGASYNFLHFRIGNHVSPLLIPSVDIRIVTEAQNIEVVAEGVSPSPQ
jgi:hypothetical protein